MRSLVIRSAMIVVAAAMPTAVAMAAKQSLPRVVMKTSLGKIVIEVNTKAAPKTGRHFLEELVGKGFLNEGMFYRSVSASTKGAAKPITQLIQGGSSPSAPSAPTIRLERTSKTGLSNTKGSVAMARETDPNSAQAQIFINISDNQALLDDKGTYGQTGGYAVFARVVRGWSVVKKIQKQPVDREELLRPVTIESATVVSAKGNGAAAKSKTAPPPNRKREARRSVTKR